MSRVLSPTQAAQCLGLVGVWLLAIAMFWMWWFDESHVVGPLRFAANSLLLLWATLLPGYYFFFLLRMRAPDRATPIPDGLRVAMVVTKAPSEPFSVVSRTLEAALNQRYPHDTWLADEDPTPDVVAWCTDRGVRLSSRKGIEDYHRPVWPRRTRCKEGNLAYFYDTYGYVAYDIVVQLDADQQPATGYLEAMLRPFADPAIGYVSAPSICDNNAESSWSARGRLYAEGTLHGSLQAGYNNGWAPLCIGSHYAVRTKALREIGGLGPELAEDHSTTLMMNAHGWRGVHAFDAEAHGDGPVSFESCMTQEFQWSKSLTTLLLTLTPRHWKQLRGRILVQFLFAQLWYPCLGVVMVLAHLMPVAALFTGLPWARVSYVEFLGHKIMWVGAALATVAWVKQQGWLRPVNSKILSWEIVAFQLARWPWVLAGSAAGIADAVRGRAWEFRITPKGEAAALDLPVRLLTPYIALASLSGIAVLGTSNPGDAGGYYYLALLNSAVYSTLSVLLVVWHRREAGEQANRIARSVLTPAVEPF